MAQTQVTQKGGPSKKQIMAIRVGVIAATVLLLLVITSMTVILARRPDDAILHGVKIEQIDVSGKTREEAIATLQENLVFDLGDKTLNVTCEDRTETITVSEFVDGYDYEGAVNKAFEVGRDGNWFTNATKAIAVALGGEEISIDYLVDEVMVTQFVDELQKNVESLVVQNQYTIENNKLKFVNGKKGYAIDKQKLADDIQMQLKSKSEYTAVETSISEVFPDPYDVEKIYNEIHREPKDARIETVDGVTRIEKASNGYDLDKNALQELLDANSDNTQPYYLDLTVIEPQVKQVDESSLFGDTLSTFTSKIRDNDSNRLNNVRKAAESINGVILNPGELFSYNDTLGPVTAEAGYKSANVYSSGKIEKGIGGGVCQVSSALYSALLLADMDIVTRYNHSLIVSYVPYGQDATVSSGDIDLRFRNNTNAPMKIVASMDKNGVYITLRGDNPQPGKKITIENITVETIPIQTTVKEEPSLPAGKVKVDQNGMTGYVIDTYKNIYIDGALAEREYVSRSRYKMLERVELHGAAGTAQPTPEPTQAPVQQTQQPTVQQPVQTPEQPVQTQEVQITPESVQQSGTEVTPAA